MSCNKFNIFGEGDTICISTPFLITNDNKPINTVELDIGIPTGLTLVQQLVTDADGNTIPSELDGTTISIPILPKGDVYVNLCFDIDDISGLSSETSLVTLTLIKDCDTNINDNTSERCLEGFLCSDFNKCLTNDTPITDITAIANGVSLTLGTCDTSYGNLSLTDTPCDSKTSIWKLVAGSEINCNAVVGAGGDFLFKIQDCTNGGEFLYDIECADGSTYRNKVAISLI